MINRKYYDLRRKKEGYETILEKKLRNKTMRMQWNWRRTGSGTPPNRSRTWTARSTAWKREKKNELWIQKGIEETWERDIELLTRRRTSASLDAKKGFDEWVLRFRKRYLLHFRRPKHEPIFQGPRRTRNRWVKP